ncbi:putative lipoprotein [Aliivibrio wodanis]|uniref:Putative lipoprotein n=1 Tax=Aliivibrio wodanis TaxID=80852 RepID=A0A090I5J0_9GAMM|nr:putative lipoprotein [Aliivibrio wodanis]VVV06668.1 hypothetical protein AW0309160_04162 [Aliivibrio wodanis]
MNKTLTVALLLSATLVTGCTTMTPEECQNANWQAIGYQDGKNGSDYSRLQTYVEECKEAGISVDQQEWFVGQKSGLRLYCLPDNGYRVGLAGNNYNGVCANGEFVEQYNLGYKTYQIEKEISEVESELQRINWQLDALDSKEKDKRKQLKEERKRLDMKRIGLMFEKTRLAKPQYGFSFEFY